MSRGIPISILPYAVIPTTADLGLVDYAGSVDPSAPQLYTLFDDHRTPIFNAAYQVYQWDWNCNCRAGRSPNGL
jgi:hypothetical protein